MGAYLSEPITEKVSTDEANDKIICGASSMQGWRESQEDAHNCILEFDTNTSYFAVYDGHGGREVAQYCSQELPEFLKTLEKYKLGHYAEALEEAFLKFDATIATPEIKATLKRIALNSDGKEEYSEEEENVNNLYEEATMPIEQVIEKYTSSKLKNLKDGEKLAVSPILKSRKSSEAPGTSRAGGSSSKVTETPSDVVSSTSSAKTDEISSSDSVGNGSKKSEETDNVVTSEGSSSKPDSSDDMKISKGGGIENESSNQNGEANLVSSSSPQENGKIVDKKKGKGKALMKTRGMENSILSRRRLRARRTVAQLYSSLLQHDSEDDDSEDEEDKTFEGPNESSDENEVQEGEDSDKTSDEEEEEEDEEDEEEEEQGIDDNDNGFVSGCTAVVALLKENELYVANAGDSRCIVCRKGQAVEMSVDHKPEDLPELKRIANAGGSVTDGRVDGGLNLSRAIGDHEYKQNKDLSDREQMITALPDIKTLTINPAEDEFMVLACDGIWNSMSSQEVVDFVRPRLQEKPDNVSPICEEMFDHCLAPDTMNDGTGCDNMTAIIVIFKPNIMKRSASEPDVQSQCKRAKTEKESTSQFESRV